MSMLSIKGLTKTYKGGKRAVSGLSLEIEKGDIYGFIGQNGAGKTTTIKCVTGLLDFEEGEITIDGMSVKDDGVKCRAVTAYIPDNPELYEHFTGSQYIDFICDIFRVPAARRTELVGRWAGEMGMETVLGDVISSYSHGMKQKLAIIAALAHSPRLMVLDEPFVGLDPAAAVSLKRAMAGICREGGAIFFSTHVLDVAQKLCTKAAILKDGRLVASGTMDSLTGGRSLEDVFMDVMGLKNAEDKG